MKQAQPTLFYRLKPTRRLEVTSLTYDDTRREVREGMLQEARNQATSWISPEKK